MLLCLLCPETHILSTSSLSLSSTRLLKSFLAERGLEVSICVISASIMSLFAWLQKIAQPLRRCLTMVTCILAILV
jgi:hypothetical protein